MTVPIVTFFNNKGGVGKTSLVFHLSWMLSEQGHRVVALDLDPQANLTSAFLETDELLSLWAHDNHHPDTGNTIHDCVRPLTKVGDLLSPNTRAIRTGLDMVPGDLGLASFEDYLSDVWPKALDSGELYRPFRLLTAFWQIAQRAAATCEADLVLVDVGPNLGAINRSALIASDHVVVPLAADLFSLQGLRNLGPTLVAWREGWSRRVRGWSDAEFDLPSGSMCPLGYVLMQHSERLSRPVKAYSHWAERIPRTYAECVIGSTVTAPTSLAADPNCIARLKHYRSLVPMAQEAHKPIFGLSSADGAIGSHANAVRDARTEFGALASVIADRVLGIDF